jgi:broad specificity phosphatase PhoE
MSARRIFLARHGNRQDFVDPRWLDQAQEPYDPPLSADGVEQARRLGQRLAGEGITAIVSSPFLRTIQTAHHANETLAVPIHLEPAFGEWLASDSFERVPRLEPRERLAARYPRFGEGYVATGSLCHPETIEQVRARAQRGLRELLPQLKGTLLVVGHAASIVALASLDPKALSVPCPMCALFCLEQQGTRWRLAISGEVAHLAPARR